MHAPRTNEGPPPSDPAIARAVARLREGGLVAFPTETVYGLGADALNEAAVARVFAVKGRPSRNPLIVHVADAAAARPLVASWPEAAERLARAFWPGPLSIVLPKSAAVPALVTGGGPNVALRCPDHPVALSLLRAFGPLVGPSANRSGRVSPTTAAHVREAFPDAAEVLLLDGGACRAGIESTVVSLVGDRPRVLRPGIIGKERLAGVLGTAVDGPTGPTPGDGAFDSPGQLESHYAPAAPARLCDAADLAEILDAGGRIAVLGPAALVVAEPHRLYAIPSDAMGYAAGLYAALREADRRRPDLIAVVAPWTYAEDPTDPVWEAVADRLRRACRPGR